MPIIARVDDRGTTDILVSSSSSSSSSSLVPVIALKSNIEGWRASTTLSSHFWHAGKPPPHITSRLELIVIDCFKKHFLMLLGFFTTWEPRFGSNAPKGNDLTFRCQMGAGTKNHNAVWQKSAWVYLPLDSGVSGGCIFLFCKFTQTA